MENESLNEGHGFSRAIFMVHVRALAPEVRLFDHVAWGTVSRMQKRG
jgi:hypothetical protein